jgi:hypothetical protein
LGGGDEEESVKIFGREVKGHAKRLVIFVAILLVTSGLCGITMVLQGDHGWMGSEPRNPWEYFLVYLGFIEYFVSLICIGGIILTCVAWIIGSIREFVKSRNADKKEKFAANIEPFEIVKEKTDDSK